MVSSRTACEIARSLPNVSEKDHFGSDAFIAHKRIFATVWHDKAEVNLMFTTAQQNEFLEMDVEAFSPVPNKWGEKGATTAHLKYIDKALLAKALKAAWGTCTAKSASKKSKAQKKSKS